MQKLTEGPTWTEVSYLHSLDQLIQCRCPRHVFAANTNCHSSMSCIYRHTADAGCFVLFVCFVIFCFVLFCYIIAAYTTVLYVSLQTL